jgi:hypothetical protein
MTTYKYEQFKSISDRYILILTLARIPHDYREIFTSDSWQLPYFLRVGVETSFITYQFRIVSRPVEW